jgi:hypothetical protein
LAHQAGDKRDIATQPVEFGDEDWATVAPCRRQGSGKLGSAIQSIGPLPALLFDKRLD